MFFFAIENGNAFTELFTSNIANWAILMVALVFGWNKLTPGLFAARDKQINTTLNDAKVALEEGKAFLERQEERLNKDASELKAIVPEAERVAEQMKAQIAEQTRKELEDLEKKVDQQIATQRQMAIAELRSQAATGAVRLAEACLPGGITDSVKKGMQSQFIAQMDNIGGN